MAGGHHRQHGRSEGGEGDPGEDVERGGNEASPPDTGRGWTRDEMERAEPYPMPELPDEDSQDEEPEGD